MGINQEKLHQFWYNVEQSLSVYSDVGAVRGWLRRSAKELSSEELKKLLALLAHWLEGHALDQTRNKLVLDAMQEVDADGDAARRVAIESAHIRAEREREQRRQEEERERAKAEERREQIRRKQAHEAQLRAERDAAVTKLKHVLETDFLSSEKCYHENFKHVLREHEFVALKRDTVRSWLGSLPRAADRRAMVFDDEQIDAIGAVNGHTIVVARAGSGKTATLVARTHFLIQRCGVSAGQILLLAFNERAATEMLRRILELLGGERHGAFVSSDKLPLEQAQILELAEKLGVELPHVMTFHALARAIVATDCKKRGVPTPDIVADREHDLTQSQVIQEVIDELLRSPEGHRQVREVMLDHFSQDWERLIGGFYDRCPAEFLRLRRSIPHLTLNNEYVKSRGEKLIADFLFEHDLPYVYEKSFWARGIDYRPDFTLFQDDRRGVVIEYFGLLGNAGYDSEADMKRSFWATQPDWRFVEVAPADLREGRADLFLGGLLEQLRQYGFKCKRLSEDEIWERARQRAVDRFTRAMRSFVSRCRKLDLSPSGLKERATTLPHITAAEGKFADLAAGVYAGYLERLDATGCEDFDGILHRALALIRAGQKSFVRRSGVCELPDLRFICVDEYQDFSELFDRLLASIRETSPRAGLFCVGDDWQAINGFAGSDLRFFQQFEKHHPAARLLFIGTNYRSAEAVVARGNALMAGRGPEARPHRNAQPGSAVIGDLGTFAPTAIETGRHGRGLLVPAALRLIHRAIRNDQDVVLLSRRNGLPCRGRYDGSDPEEFLKLVRKHLPQSWRDRVSVSTVHRFKGLEKGCVIILDAVASSFPLIHPDWIFTRILGDSVEKIVDEERRLFYVALTRAAHSVVILTDGSERSIYLDDAAPAGTCDLVNWPDYPPPPHEQKNVVVRIGNRQGYGVAPTLALKDHLKAKRFRWESREWSSWVRSEPQESFAIEKLKQEPWAPIAHNVEVRVHDENGSLLESHLIEAGVWRRLTDGGLDRNRTNRQTTQGPGEVA